MTIWLATRINYKVGVRDGKVIALNKAGKELKPVPAKLKDNEVTAKLRDLLEWLAGDERETASQINDLMVQLLPMPPGSGMPIAFTGPSCCSSCSPLRRAWLALAVFAQAWMAGRLAKSQLGRKLLGIGKLR